MSPAQRHLARFLVFVVVLGAGFSTMRWGPLAPYLELNRISEVLEILRSQKAAPVIYLGGAVLLAAFGLPASVMILVAGAVFGAFRGGLLALAAMVGGALLSYIFARWLARDFLTHVLGPRTQVVERLIGSQGFWALTRLRFVPLPFPVINYGMALAGVDLGVFVFSTTVGVIPAVSVLSYFSASLVGAAEAERSEALLQVALALLGLFVLSFLPNLLKSWQARRVRHRPPAGRS